MAVPILFSFITQGSVPTGFLSQFVTQGSCCSTSKVLPSPAVSVSSVLLILIHTGRTLGILTLFFPPTGTPRIAGPQGTPRTPGATGEFPAPLPRASQTKKTPQPFQQIIQLHNFPHVGNEKQWYPKKKKKSCLRVCLLPHFQWCHVQSRQQQICPT